ncbi:MAG: hypothetical protein E7318_10815 [Clostridiales bacterium]|nr:hypothetical protein [Clostridiales bacterium]
MSYNIGDFDTAVQLLRYIGGIDNPDISARIGHVSVHVECKRVERLALAAALRQAHRDANGHALPVVVHRRSREPWLVTMELTDLLQIIGKGPPPCKE